MNAKLNVNTIVPAALNDTGRGTVRIWPGAIDRKKADRARFFRGEAVTIVNVGNGKKVVRRVIGGNTAYRLDRGTVALDYDTRDTLGVYHLKTGVTLAIRRATPFEKLWSFWNTDDASVRIANRLSLVGVLIAIIPLVMALLSMVHGW